VYRSACLPFIQRALDSRRLRLLDLIRDLKAETVEIDAIVDNVNTPEQWAAWQAANI
jgi:molybdopterin-guanine dinucleotide biosynthesis protein A